MRVKKLNRKIFSIVLRHQITEVKLTMISQIYIQEVYITFYISLIQVYLLIYFHIIGKQYSLICLIYNFLVFLIIYIRIRYLKLIPASINWFYPAILPFQWWRRRFFSRSQTQKDLNWHNIWSLLITFFVCSRI